MTLEDLSTAASELQIQTYLSLGLSTPGSAFVQEAGYDACLGNFDHPICNFAARLKLDPWVGNQLIDLAHSRGAFNVYSAPGDLPLKRETRDEILIRAGFRRGFSLHQMVSNEAPKIDPVPIDQAQTPTQRKEISTFMGNQFFSQQSANFRRRVVDATVAAKELDLYSVRPHGDLLAALMLVESPDLLGLFNLCVRPHAQNRGWGAAVVAEVLRRGVELSKTVVLQCDESLIPWYEHLGFHKTGVVDVYVLPEERRIAIMN